MGGRKGPFFYAWISSPMTCVRGRVSHFTQVKCDLPPSPVTLACRGTRMTGEGGE